MSSSKIFATERWIPLLCLLSSLLFLGCLINVSLLAAMETYGTAVPGTVTYYEIRPNEFANPGLHYFLGYQYKVNGKTYEGCAPTDPVTYLRLKGLAPIQVRILPILPDLYKKALILPEHQKRDFKAEWLGDLVFASLPLLTCLWLKQKYLKRKNNL